MYKKLKTYIPDTRDPEVQKKELIEYFQQEFFDNRNVYSISTAMQKIGVTVEKYAIYRQYAELNISDIKKTVQNNPKPYKNDFSKMMYILSLIRYHVSNDIEPAEPKQEPKDPPPAPPQAKAKPQYEPAPESASKPPKHTSKEDDPIITDADLFEVDPDIEAIHEAWAKLSEDERRENWEKAIAAHRQQRKPEYAPDEMY